MAEIDTNKILGRTDGTRPTKKKDPSQEEIDRRLQDFDRDAKIEKLENKVAKMEKQRKTGFFKKVALVTCAMVAAAAMAFGITKCTLDNTNYPGTDTNSTENSNIEDSTDKTTTGSSTTDSSTTDSGNRGPEDPEPPIVTGAYELSVEEQQALENKMFERDSDKEKCDETTLKIIGTVLKSGATEKYAFVTATETGKDGKVSNVLYRLAYESTVEPGDMAGETAEILDERTGVKNITKYNTLSDLAQGDEDVAKQLQDSINNLSEKSLENVYATVSVSGKTLDIAVDYVGLSEDKIVTGTAVTTFEKGDTTLTSKATYALKAVKDTYAELQKIKEAQEAIENEQKDTSITDQLSISKKILDDLTRNK